MSELLNDALWDRELSLERTVARELVHKAAIEQVLLSDNCAVGDAFLCCGQLPRTHLYYSDSLCHSYDPLLLLEAARQAGILVSHRYLGVPDSARFIFAHLQLEYVDPHAARVGREPATVHVHLGFSESRRRRGAVAGGRMSAHVYVDRVHVLNTWGDLTYVSAGAYRALRGHSRHGGSSKPATATPQQVLPRAVARSNPQNVVVGPLSCLQPGVASAPVLVDQSHATFFDHPLDHVPGALLVEALRQSALLQAAHTFGVPAEHLLLLRAETSYEVFAELGSPIVCTIHEAGGPDPQGTLAIALRLEQDSRQLASGNFVFEEDRSR